MFAECSEAINLYNGQAATNLYNYRSVYICLYPSLLVTLWRQDTRSNGSYMDAVFECVVHLESEIGTSLLHSFAKEVG